MRVQTAEQNSAIRANILEFMSSLPASVTPTRGDLILGFAMGYKPHVIAPFVESLRAHGQFAGKVVLFVNPDARKTAEYLSTHGIDAFALERSKSPVGHFNLARCFWYFKYLREQWDASAVFSQILLTDVRDVIFQKPLFGTPCDDLEFHLEDNSSTIGEDWFTARGIESAYGKQAVLDLSTKTVSCAGTVSGRALGILDYLAQKQLLAAALPKSARSKWGIDQALHNYILHKRLARLAISKPNFARVANVGNANAKVFGCDAKGRVINPDGGISEVAHQWDRHRHLTKTICAAYLDNGVHGRWRLQMARILPRLALSTWGLQLARVKLELVGRYSLWRPARSEDVSRG
jgi:hypothetical protein